MTTSAINSTYLLSLRLMKTSVGSQGTRFYVSKDDDQRLYIDGGDGYIFSTSHEDNICTVMMEPFVSGNKAITVVDIDDDPYVNYEYPYILVDELNSRLVTVIDSTQYIVYFLTSSAFFSIYRQIYQYSYIEDQMLKIEPSSLCFGYEMDWEEESIFDQPEVEGKVVVSFYAEWVGAHALADILIETVEEEIGPMESYAFQLYLNVRSWQRNGGGKMEDYYELIDNETLYQGAPYQSLWWYFQFYPSSQYIIERFLQMVSK